MADYGHRTTLERVLSGRADASIRFMELRRLLLRLNFTERVRGSHHKYGRADIAEIIVLQPVSGGNAKAYQVKHAHRILERYRFHEADDV